MEIEPDHWGWDQEQDEALAIAAGITELAGAGSAKVARRAADVVGKVARAASVDRPGVAGEVMVILQEQLLLREVC